MEWSDDKILQLIKFYEENECLYNVSLSTYHNQLQRPLRRLHHWTPFLANVNVLRYVCYML